MPNLNRLLADSFRVDQDLISFEIHRHLSDHFQEAAILATQEDDFNLSGFAEDGRCLLWNAEGLQSLYLAQWHGRQKGIDLESVHAFVNVRWNCHNLKVLSTKIDCSSYHYILADSMEIAHAFFTSVCLFSTDAEGSVLVYNGRFQRDSNLEEGIRISDWESLILPVVVKDELQRNVYDFFEAHETYKRYRLPWKRGILLHGPPGNGKTHAIKALIRQAGRPCIVAKTFRGNRFVPEEKSIATFFERARQIAPAILLFEDIDTLISKNGLSSLLNEMDGIAANTGLLFLATTNHLTRLDPALANRPSRFDCKVMLGNMRKPERLRMLKARFDQLDPEMKPSEEAIESAAAASTGFSGAMMQELIRACTSMWLASRVRSSMDKILEREVERLRPRKGKGAPNEEED